MIKSKIVNKNDHINMCDLLMFCFGKFKLQFFSKIVNKKEKDKVNISICCLN